MARLGRIQRTESGVYRDLDTGRFLSYDDVEPILYEARVYGLMGSQVRGRYAKAALTISESLGINSSEANRLIAEYRADYATWEEEGGRGDEPEFPSPG